jgi:hypothetical protein
MWLIFFIFCYHQSSIVRSVRQQDGSSTIDSDKSVSFASENFVFTATNTRKTVTFAIARNAARPCVSTQTTIKNIVKESLTGKNILNFWFYHAGEYYGVKTVFFTKTLLWNPRKKSCFFYDVLFCKWLQVHLVSHKNNRNLSVITYLFHNFIVFIRWK